MRHRQHPVAITVALMGAAVVLTATFATASATRGKPSAPSPAGQGFSPSPAGRASSPSPSPSITRMVRIPAGSYLPLYTEGGRSDERVGLAAFRLDEHAVTRAQYAVFVTEHPEWRRSGAEGARAGSGYLAGWQGDVAFGSARDGARPVTQVPLPAAQAYCAAQGKRLPTTEEWEYAAAASVDRRDASADPAFRQWLLDLYTAPRPAQPLTVRSGFRNAYGVWDLHGLVWEWTVPAAPQPMVGMHHAMRHPEGTKHDLGCAGGAAGASDTRDYPAFLRYAFRSALATTSMSLNLGFRCAG